MSEEKLLQETIKELKDVNKSLATLVKATPAPSKGASATEIARKEQQVQQKQTSLFEDMAGSLKSLHRSFLESVKEKGKMGLGIIIAAIAAPIVALVAFFKQLAVEFKFLKSLTGGALGKLFAPLKALFGGTGPVGKAFASLGQTIKAITDTIKSSKGFKAIEGVGKTIKSAFASLIKFMKPASDFFKSVFGMGKNLATGAKTAQGILKFAAKFGTILGKIFLPITIIMSAFDFITGFMDGYKEGGILGGLKGGLTKLFQGLIGMPLDLLKKGVAWILGVFGFDKAKAWLNSFSFSKLIGDMIGGLFDMIGKVVDWVKLLFKDPLAALDVLWKKILGGFASVMDILWSPIKDGIAWVMKLFGWDEAAAATEKFSIKDFILGVFTTVKDWIVGLFSWGKKAGATEEGGWSLSKMITGVWDSVTKWFEDLFKFDTKAIAKGIDILLWLPNMVMKGVTAVGSWLLGLFGFDDAAKKVADVGKFSLGGLIMDALIGIKDFFWNKEGTGVLQFKLSGIMPDFEMPDFGAMIRRVVKAVFPTSLFDTSFFGYSLKDFLPDSLVKFLTEPDKKMAAGGAFEKGQSMLVGELGPELILPNSGGQVMTAGRTDQMMQASIQKSVEALGAAGGSPGTINTGGNTVVNHNTQQTHNTGSGVAVRRPIQLGRR